MKALSASFAAKVLAGGVALALLLISSVSVFLLVSQRRAAEASALSEATNRTAAARQLLDQVAGGQTLLAAKGMSRDPTLAGELYIDPTTVPVAYRTLALQQYLSSSDTTVVSDVPSDGPACLTTPLQTLTSTFANLVFPLDAEMQRLTEFAIFDRTGTLMCAQIPHDSHVATASAHSVAVQRALADKPSQGIEVVGSSTSPEPVVSVAAPVHFTGVKPVLGAIAYVAPLGLQLRKAHSAIAYTPSFVITDCNQGKIALCPIRVSYAVQNDHVVGQYHSVSPDLVAQLTASKSETGVVSNLTTGEGAAATAYAPMCAPRSSASEGCHVVGYVGVEVPVASFAPQQTHDEIMLLWIAFTALLLSSLAVLLFVEKFVARPVRLLDAGVARIGAGDYTTEVPATSSDELGRLANGVNRMSAQISAYVQHVDTSVRRLGEVAQALTTTTTGVEQLRRAVLGAATAIVGSGSTGALIQRAGDALTIAATIGENDFAVSMAPEHEAELVRGEVVHAIAAGKHITVLPMFYREEVIGGLAVATDVSLPEGDERSLRVLANNAAIALENARLYDQERATVQRLRELDSLKTDFLSTARHELRTPLMAIMGQLEVLKLAWDQWAENTKLEYLEDIEISTRLLDELLETMLDYSLVSGNVQLQFASARLIDAVGDALGDIKNHFKGDLPVSVETDVPEGLRVHADPKRLRQVLRAILDNSLKFAPKGRVTIKAHVNGESAVIDIHDTGVGISETAIPHIFDAFFQEDNSGTRAFGGMGMGLALAKRLTDAHGAEISVLSTLGSETTVTLRWPLARPTDQPEQPSADGFHRAR